jgi:hypothetical protein
MPFIGWTSPTASVTIGSMSEPDAVPLPREGEVFFDVRGESRTMRLSWYADSSVAVFSIWQRNRCTGTFRLPFADLARMVATLQAGPPSAGAEPAPVHPGQPAYGHGPSDPGYGYPEPSGYGQPAAYAPAAGYGGGPEYGTGPGYGYRSEHGGPYDSAGGQPGADQYHERAAASGRQGYGPPDRQSARDGYGAPDPYGTADFDGGEPLRYVPDVADQTRQYQPGADHFRESHGYAEPPRGYADDRGYAQSSGQLESRGRAESPGYGTHGYAEPHPDAEPHGYPGSGGHAASARHGRHADYEDQHSDAYRGETQFLAPPAAPPGYQADPRPPAWRDDQTEPQGEPSPSRHRARAAKTEQATQDWGPATASYRAH